MSLGSGSESSLRPSVHLADNSGPVPGLSKRAEWRVQQCENALWYLLGLPGVSDAVKTAIASGVPEPPVSKKKGKARRGSEDEIEQVGFGSGQS